MWRCEKDCHINRVWGTDECKRGWLLYVWSCPWTGAGTFVCDLYEWDGQTPIKSGYLHIKSKESWYYESNWNDPDQCHRGHCPYRWFSQFLKNTEYWTYMGVYKFIVY